MTRGCRTWRFRLTHSTFLNFQFMNERNAKRTACSVPCRLRQKSELSPSLSGPSGSRNVRLKNAPQRDTLQTLQGNSRPWNATENVSFGFWVNRRKEAISTWVQDEGVDEWCGRVIRTFYQKYPPALHEADQLCKKKKKKKLSPVVVCR